MDKTLKLILDSIDADISEHFSALEPGSYMPLLPLYIHIGRHLAKVSSLLKGHDDRGGGPDTGREKEE